MSEAGSSSNLLSEEEFRLALKRLNAIIGVGLGWQKTTAIKSHKDEFGVSIQSDEDYYKRNDGPSFSSVLKLSRASMEKVLYMTVYQCGTIEYVGDQLIAEQQAQFNAIRDRIEKK